MTKTIKIMTATLAVLVLTLGLTLTSCEKPEKGETGPQGAQGSAGVQGPAGPQGSSGPQGTTGNANVNTIIENIASGNWVLSGNTYYVDITVSEINSDIINTGAVSIFMESTTQTGIWLNMPWIEYGSATYFSTYNYNYGLGGVRIFKSDSDLTAPSNPGVRKFKIVVIASSGIAQNPDVDLKDYNAVKVAFNLKD